MPDMTLEKLKTPAGFMNFLERERPYLPHWEGIQNPPRGFESSVKS
jgi:hypothetical protein